MSWHLEQSVQCFVNMNLEIEYATSIVLNNVQS